MRSNYNKPTIIARHRWFAWYPVWAWETCTDEGYYDGELGIVWLEHVWRERKENYHNVHHILIKP